MHKPKNGFKGFVENWQADLKAGFVVSLVALPISIALSLASGAPAIAGLIAAIIGGILVAHLGGSYVTITGPGNGLAVVTLAAITSLGGGDMLAGYYMALGAIVVSGLLLFLLGTIRLGVLADLFPTSAVQGMLAAIGIIILAKQSHVMIGTLNPESGSPIPLLIEFFSSLETLMWADTEHMRSAIVGIGSLLFLIGFSKIRVGWVHAVPAPLWVVVLAVLAQYIGTNVTGESFFGPKYLVNIPADWMSTWRLPDFSGIQSGAFWGAAVSLTFIASIESLLSIKGMDRLDPYKRKSNVNKDLRALGIATTVSGLLGGLSVVTVIARSSVNVSNGAKTRSANFFHGILILIFILFLREMLTQIPLPALAAILVYTGYKLLNPSQFSKIAQVGLEQLFLFFFTLFATLIYGLISGIVLGMAATLIIQFIITGAATEIVRYFNRPNTLLYEEEENKYILNINYFANFLNYPRLKSKLDSIPTSAELIADFSNTSFVDATVMEHLAGYVESFEQHGGSLDLVGLDAMAPASSHPLGVQSKSTRGSNVFQQQTTTTRLSNKQEKLSKFAVIEGLKYTAWPDLTWDEKVNQFDYFRHHRIDQTINLLEDRKSKLIALEVVTHIGEFTMLDSQHMACVVLHPEGISLPKFTLDRERIFGRISNLAGIQDIELGSDQFDRRFNLKGEDEKAIKEFFNPECLAFLASHPVFHMESNGDALLIFHKERAASVAEFKLMVSFARDFYQRICAKS
ncbi:MAG: sulfate transporter [Flavobacteriales bacterium]|nr:sulfate transporter [Flavobacteriales bacterium]